MCALSACSSKKETTEDCIAWIYDNTRTVSSTTVAANGKIIKQYADVLQLKDNNGKWLEINNETAISLSHNWTMDKNMKYYTKDSIIEEHEKDACKTKARIKEFLNNLNQ